MAVFWFFQNHRPSVSFLRRMVHDFDMDMEVSTNSRKTNGQDEEISLNRLSALLTLATDSNSTISATAVDELCRLDSTSIEFIATDLLTLTDVITNQSSREKIFRLLTPYHHLLPALSTALVLELLGEDRQQDLALEILPLLPSSSLGALPVLVFLAERSLPSDPARGNLFIECARNISALTDPFISRFAPKLLHQIRKKMPLPKELEICGRLLFTGDHDVFTHPMRNLLESGSLNEGSLAPTSVFLLLGRDLAKLPLQTQIGALRIASLAPRTTRHYGERVSRAIREDSPAIVRQCGLYLIMKIAPQEFPNFADDFEALLLSDNDYATLCAALTAHLVSDTFSQEHQIFLVDSLLRAAKESPLDKYKNILFCMQSFDAEHTLPHLFKLFLNAPSTEYEKSTGATIQKIKDLIPDSRRAVVLTRVKRDLRAELPSFTSFINTIMG
jgi:hypothetical protein